MTKISTKIFRILLDSTTDLDMPPEMAITSNYCATLGHKVMLDTVLSLATKNDYILSDLFQSVTNILNFSNIQIFSIQIFIWTFVRINFLDTNIFGYSFVSFS